MKNKPIVMGTAVGTLFATLLVIGASPASRQQAQWEYGVYIESAGNYEWQDANRQVRANSVGLFFERMDLPADLEIDARTGRVPTVFLNQLGRRGWEIVEVVVGTEQNNYWLKRPQ